MSEVGATADDRPYYAEGFVGQAADEGNDRCQRKVVNGENRDSAGFSVDKLYLPFLSRVLKLHIMLNIDDRKKILDLAAKYALKKVLLFGSAARMDSGYKDIDLAVDGIRPQDFFRLYGELLTQLSLPVDLLDLSRPSRFGNIVREEGMLLYG